MAKTSYSLVWRYGSKPHLSKLVELTSIKAKLIYLEPVNTKNFENRKDLSNYLEGRIRKSLF